MSSETVTTNARTGGDIDLDARPDRITAGGIVLLTAVLPGNVDGTFDLTWAVEGPVRLSEHDTRIALLGTTTVAGERITLNSDEDPLVVRATLDTTPLTVGTWEVVIRLVEVDGAEIEVEGGEARTVVRVLEGFDSVEVLARPFAAGDDVAVTMRRTSVSPTNDQALWVTIRQSTDAIGFDNYNRFIDRVLCGDVSGGRFRRGERHDLRKVARRTALPFPNVERYRLLKAATEVFLMVHCGADLGDFRHLDLDDESRRLNRTVEPGDLETQFRDYLTRFREPDGDEFAVLPYLGLIRQKLGDVGITVDDSEATSVCFGILAEKLTNPCFLELIWSYWIDECGLMQTLNAISRRFQNRTPGANGRRDPLENMDIDPLRALNNVIWAWIQDQQHRLTTIRRNYEYDHHYGLTLASRPGPPVRGADSRSRFVDAFHHLLAVAAAFHIRDDDTTVIADGFPVLNALKEVHLLLTQGAHNQYGDLPWTARHEMLMSQWILGRPEVRDFLPTRTMVAYPETWMGPVEAMNKLQNWADASVLHFRDLAVFGEQVLLGIRFGAWTTVIEPEQAANWARYWRAELQGYIHAHRAVTGIDLTQRAGANGNGAGSGARFRQRHQAYRG